MVVKLFVLGNPGSGKSTIARCLESLTRDEKGWFCERFNDYAILKEMTQEDGHRPEEKRWFRWLDEEDKEKGFDVLNIEAFDVALKRLEQQICEELTQYGARESEMRLMVIEFARNNYKRAFRQFSREFLQDAYFLYLDTSTEVCRRRIWERARDRLTEDDYYVSDYILQTYYSYGDGRELKEILQEREFGIRAEKIQIFDNNQDLQAASEYISQLAHSLLRQRSEQDQVTAG